MTDPPPSRPGADRPRPSPALDAAALTDALRGLRPPRRHPAEVTADRLGDHLDKWPDAFDGAGRDAIAQIRHVLQQIADGRVTGSPAPGAPGPALRPGRARTRAQALLDAWQDYGAELRFVQNATGTRVHVLAEPDIPAWARADPPQRRPTIDEITETVVGAVPAVCGVRLRCHRGGLEQGGRRIDDFPDELLCRRCHAGFTALGDAAAALIFEHNRRPDDEFSRNTDPVEEEVQRYPPAVSSDIDTSEWRRALAR